MAASGSTEESAHTQSDPGGENEGEWLDVLGSGQLRKKVRALCNYFMAYDTQSTISAEVL